MLELGILGKKTEYIKTYTKELLYPVPRSLGRENIGLYGSLPFTGQDVWTGFEISWLNLKGKPQIALGEFAFPYSSPYIVESKSFKLYLNSFNQSSFPSEKVVAETMQKDLSALCLAPISLKLLLPQEFGRQTLSDFTGVCLDDLDIETDVYMVNKDFLTAEGPIVQEALFTHLLKSNCLATGQPDWGSVWIHYKGQKIDREGLLKYIISYRDHVGFAEHCIEKIYVDILKECRPEKLTVYGRYTKRGGLDINVFRSNFESLTGNIRLVRQ